MRSPRTLSADRPRERIGLRLFERGERHRSVPLQIAAACPVTASSAAEPRVVPTCRSTSAGRRRDAGIVRSPTRREARNREPTNRGAASRLEPCLAAALQRLPPRPSRRAQDAGCSVSNAGTVCPGGGPIVGRPPPKAQPDGVQFTTGTTARESVVNESSAGRANDERIGRCTRRRRKRARLPPPTLNTLPVPYNAIGCGDAGAAPIAP